MIRKICKLPQAPTESPNQQPTASANAIFHVSPTILNPQLTTTIHPISNTFTEFRRDPKGVKSWLCVRKTLASDPGIVAN